MIGQVVYNSRSSAAVSYSYISHRGQQCRYKPAGFTEHSHQQTNTEGNMKCLIFQLTQSTMCMLYIGFKILVLSPFFNATVQECKGTTQLFSVLQRQFERPQSRHMPRERKKRKALQHRVTRRPRLPNWVAL